MCAKWFFFPHHGWIAVQTLSHPAISPQVTKPRQVPPARLPGQKLWVESLARWEKDLTQGPGQSSLGPDGPTPVALGTGMFSCWPQDWQNSMVAGGPCEVLFSSPLAGHRDTLHVAVYRAVNEPRPMGEAAEGPGPFHESQQDSSLLGRLYFMPSPRSS